MTKYVVEGGHPLFGEVRISGAKNAAVAIIPAALLVNGVCRIENIPQISDVTALLKILEQLGANIRFLNRSDVEIDCRHIACHINACHINACRHIFCRYGRFFNACRRRTGTDAPAF